MTENNLLLPTLEAELMAAETDTDSSIHSHFEPFQHSTDDDDHKLYQLDLEPMGSPAEDGASALTPKPHTLSAFSDDIQDDSSHPLETQPQHGMHSHSNQKVLLASSSSATLVPQNHSEAIDSLSSSSSKSPEIQSIFPSQAQNIPVLPQHLILDEESAKASLPDTVEKVPPSVGATSLLEPDHTISNPFAIQDNSNPNSPKKQQPSSDSSFQRLSSSANVAIKRSSQTSEQSSAPPDTPSINSNHFSVVSLGSTTASVANVSSSTDNAEWKQNRTDKRATVTTASDSNQSIPNYDFLLARLQNQTAHLKDDPKAMRASVDGADKLRENFEKLREKGQRHSRGESQNPTLRNQSLVEPQATHSDVNDQTDHWDGPLGEELGEDGINWEFWGNVMSNYQQVARSQPTELSRAIQAGIPAALRGMMWQLMSSSKDEEMEIIYAYYLKQSSPHEKAIRRDLNRTFPEQDYFQDGKGVGQENLFNVVKAYSLYDPEVGYCQGMQFVVGPLLLNMPDEEAFSTLVRLMKSYDLRGHFTPNMPSLQLRLFQFDRILEEFLPLLHMHLVRQGVKSSMYASQWFMTLFSYRFPLGLVYRILDSVFAEGIEALFRFAIALMKKNEDTLLQLNFEQVVSFLKQSLFDIYSKPDKLPFTTNTTVSGEFTGTTANGDDPKTTSFSSMSSISSSSSSSSSSTTTSTSFSATSKPTTTVTIVDEATTIRNKKNKQYRTNELVRDAFRIKITPFMLDSYAAEFDEQVRAANAHRREIEALRLVNRNLAARVKSLEEQLNSVSSEQVDLVKSVVMANIAKEEMAEELVRYKMMYAEAVLQADQENSDQNFTNKSSTRSSQPTTTTRVSSSRFAFK